MLKRKREKGKFLGKVLAKKRKTGEKKIGL
jgi:hypothetical protein